MNISHLSAEKKTAGTCFDKRLIRFLPRLVIIAGLLGSIILAAQEPVSTIDESIEPQDSYCLVVDGKDFPVFADKEVEIKFEKTSAMVALKVSQFKKFPYAGIQLEYPRQFTFEADFADDEVKFWNLSGVNTILMIQKYNTEVIETIVMGNMLSQRFGEQNTSLSVCEMELAGSKRTGTRIFTTIGDSSIAQEIYSFQIAEGCLLLILQDSVDAQGKGSVEGVLFKEQLSKTFKFAAEG